MKMYMIATLHSGSKRVGFRILDSDEGKVIDVPEQAVLQVLKSGQKINNIEIKGNKIQGNNGSIDRYARLSGGKLIDLDKAPLVILNQLGETGYTISDHNGQIRKAKIADVIGYASKNGIANGKISTRNETEFISAISGTYEKIDIQLQTQKEVGETEAKVVGETETVESPANTLAFTDIQRSVLKDYYTWANIDESIANKEIEYINTGIKENKQNSLYSDTKLLFEIISRLGSSFNIARAFGSEIGSKVICFITAELPLPKSLVEICIQQIKLDEATFLKCVFSEFEEAVDTIYEAEDDTFRLAAKTYMNYMLNKEILGKYKGFDTAEDANDKEFIGKYALCNKYTFIELIALVATTDLMKELGLTLPMVFNRSSYKHTDKLVYLVELYSNAYGIDSTTLEEKKALEDAAGLYKEYYNKEANTEFSGKVGIIDKIFDKSPYNKYENCLFDSTPILYSRNSASSSKLYIEDVYRRQLKALETGHSLILGRFADFIKGIYKEKEEKERERILEESKRNLAIEEERRQQRLEESRRLAKEEEEIRRLEEAEKERTREAQTDVKIGQPKIDRDTRKKEELKEAIDSGEDLRGFDKVEIYKELKSRVQEELSEKCFVIADDMVNRGLKYDDMSKNQKYRFDEAIAHLLIKNNSKSKSELKEEENKSYRLDENEDIKNNVNRLIEKADSVEMSAVLKVEPIVLKICYSVLKYNRASDKQLKHINKAIEILDKQ